MKLSKRAEMNDRAKLVSTFVDAGTLFTLLSNRDHQVMYGRRGTGKTHALSYLAEDRKKAGDIPVYIDMRVIGSTGGIYSDTTLPLTQRATRLLVDTLVAIHGALRSFFVENSELYDLSKTGPALDIFIEEATKVVVVGSLEVEDRLTGSSEETQRSDAELGLSDSGLSAKFHDANEATSKLALENIRKQSGVVHYHIQFGAITKILNELAVQLGKRRIWVLLDEWSSVPIELQPFLADLLRRSIFPLQQFTVKIAAIEQRSKFKLNKIGGDYIGIELGADAAADLNFDDFMVFDNDEHRAKQFFLELLFKHFRATEGLLPELGPQTTGELVQQAFTQANVFEEFVRATEGVPRDAINIITLAAQKALDHKISIEHLRIASRNWYQRDKETAVRSNNQAHTLLHWIIDRVIGDRHARAFLLRTDTENSLIEDLFDARVLHVLKRNISAHDEPGVRYNVFKLDYGCYVDLITTAKAPQGLLQLDTPPEGEPAYVEVPPDDYRAIRRAILKLEDFQKYNP